MTAARNVAIIALIALAVWALPGGGTAARLFGALLFVALTIFMGLFFARLYQEHRLTLYGLGDAYRALLYGAIAVVVLLLAGGSRMFDTSTGTLLWFVLVAGVIGALLAVVRRAREY